MPWLVTWLLFATFMFILLVITDPETRDLGVAFYAWLGGIVSVKMGQEVMKKITHRPVDY